MADSASSHSWMTHPDGAPAYVTGFASRPREHAVTEPPT
jgi:hypothetical protein